MNSFKIFLYLGVAIMALHLILGLRESKYDFSPLGAVLIVIGYLKYKLWYIVYVILGILILIEIYNDIMLMIDFITSKPKPTKAPITTSSPTTKSKPTSKPKSKNTTKPQTTKPSTSTPSPSK